MVYWAILLISSFLNAAQFILEWILLILAHTLNGVKLWCLFLARRFGIPLLDWLFVGVNNVNLRLHELLFNLGIINPLFENMLMGILWVKVGHYSKLVLCAAFKDLKVLTGYVIKAFKACLNSFISLNSFIKPLVLVSHFALLTAAVYHIIITYDSPWIGPIIQELSSLNEEIVDALRRERFIYCVRAELSYFSLIGDWSSMTSRIPITEFPYFTPYEDINDRHQEYSATHLLCNEASLYPYSQNSWDKKTCLRRFYFGQDINGYVRNTYKDYNPYYELNNSQIPNPFNLYHPFRVVNYGIYTRNHQALNYMISRSTTQPYGSWDPVVIRYLLSVRDVIAFNSKDLTLSEVAHFGNFCDAVHGYKAGVFVETIYSDVVFPL